MKEQQKLLQQQLSGKRAWAFLMELLMRRKVTRGLWLMKAFLAGLAVLSRKTRLMTCRMSKCRLQRSLKRIYGKIHSPISTMILMKRNLMGMQRIKMMMILTRMMMNKMMMSMRMMKMMMKRRIEL
uniref:Uncharacterized protein n=1 Tax=Rhizophora mucronata TaxID=61149 RepID=A0A2P2LFW4_RHIMU